MENQVDTQNPKQKKKAITKVGIDTRMVVTE